MNKSTLPTQFEEIPKTYLELVSVLMPRPIHDDVSYDNTVELIDRMAGHKLNEEQEDYFDLLSQLIESYESKDMKPDKEIRGLNALKFLLEENSLGGDQLAEILNIDRSVAFKILKGSRNLTLDHISKLSKRFAVNPGLFVP